MSAYNWIIIEACCPVCHKQIELRCQTHVASDYDGDQTGRFHEREYRLGEPLRWWPKDHKKYSTWRVNGKIDAPTDVETDWESCYATCPVCAANLYAIIKFKGPIPVAVNEVGLEDDWPKDYKK